MKQFKLSFPKGGGTVNDLASIPMLVCKSGGHGSEHRKVMSGTVLRVGRRRLIRIGWELCDNAQIFSWCRVYPVLSEGIEIMARLFIYANVKIEEENNIAITEKSYFYGPH